MQSESERALAIREGHRNAADAAYFNERPHLADDNGIRVFDAGFDRGWDAACAERDARIAELERLRSEDHSHALDLAAEIERLTQQLAEARKDAKTFTEEQIDAAVKAWFAEKIIPGRYPFSKRMRAAIAAAIKEQT